MLCKEVFVTKREENGGGGEEWALFEQKLC